MDQIKRTIIDEYWLKKLSGEFPKVILPLHRGMKEGAIKTHDTGKARHTIDIQVPAPVAEKLTNAAKQSDMGLFILALSGLYIVLSKYTGISDLTIGTMPPEVQTGSSELLFCRSSVSDTMTVKECIMQIKQEVMEALKYSEYSLETLLEKLQAKNSDSLANMFNVAFILTPLQPRDTSLDRFDLLFLLVRENNLLGLRINYDPQSLTSEVITAFGQNFVNTFDNMLKQTDLTISRLEVLDEEEKKRWIYEFNRTDAPYPCDKTIHQLFEDQLSARPDRIAVAGRQSLSYSHLNHRSNQLAAALRENGVLPGELVALMVERSPLMIIGILGILKSGAAYMPVSSEYPLNRLQYIFADSNVRLLITQSHLADRSRFEGTIVELDKPGRYNHCPAVNPTPGVDSGPHSSAYIYLHIRFHG